MNKNSADGCPACDHGSFAPLIDFGLVPRSGTFLSRPADAFAQIQLSFEYCLHCALLRQKPTGEVSGNYTDISRSTAGQLPAYATYLADSLQLSGVTTEDFVVEVGANDGAFLDVLARSGFTNTLGIEPSRNCAEACRTKGHKVYERHLTAAEASAIREKYGPARAVVCRHTLEHVPNPYAFLIAVRSLLAEEGTLFLEVPNARAVTHELRGHELWDEHLHIFTPQNLAMLVGRAKFVMTKTVVWPHHATTNILLWATTSAAPEGLGIPDSCAEDIRFCEALESRWRALSRYMAGVLSRAHKPIGMIGAAHPQSNYAIFAGLSSNIDFLVDDDPQKAGRYVPLPQPVKVLSSADFLDTKMAATMLRTAFGCDEWMDRLLAPLIIRGGGVVQPYETRSFLLQQLCRSSQL
jgi:2-polyprenyl-3-methyl-5-hydroxy-6-metoxy-1,4-benzoquinol methylase